MRKEHERDKQVDEASSPLRDFEQKATDLTLKLKTDQQPWGRETDH